MRIEMNPRNQITVLSGTPFKRTLLNNFKDIKKKTENFNYKVVDTINQKKTSAIKSHKDD